MKGKLKTVGPKHSRLEQRNAARWFTYWLVGAAYIGISPSALAEGAYLGELVTQRLGASSEIGALDDGLFGEQVDWYSGATVFSVTDVSVPGNGALPFSVGRTHRVGAREVVNSGLFGNWNLDLPHVYATFLDGDNWAAAPCSAKSSPPSRWRTVTNGYTAASDFLHSPEYWDGNRMHIPGAADRLMMIGNSVLPKPPDGDAYPWVTTDNWRFSCIPIKRGAGEGFLALSPEGTRYYFDIAYEHDAYPLIWHFFLYAQGGGSQYWGEAPLFRRKVHLFPSRIEDRLGNRVDFGWEMGNANDARLNYMMSSDGRRVDFAYRWIEPTGTFDPNASGYKIESITVNGQSWRYEYDARSLLTKVILPDLSTWELSPSYAYPTFLSAGGDPCNGLAWDVNKNTFVYTMKHPSGAQGKFTFKTTAQGRANVSPKCSWDSYLREDKNQSPGKYIAIPALHRKEISGPGLPQQVWTVTWNSTPSTDASWLGENQGDTLKSVAVSAPSGMFTRYTFSNNFGVDEGRLLKVERGGGPAQILSITERTYDTDSASPPYLREVGGGGGANYIGANPLDRRVIPIRSVRVTQDGRVFTRAVEAYDQFARPIRIKRMSEPLPLPPENPGPEPEPPPCSGCQVP